MDDLIKELSEEIEKFEALGITEDMYVKGYISGIKSAIRAYKQQIEIYENDCVEKGTDLVNWYSYHLKQVIPIKEERKFLLGYIDSFDVAEGIANNIQTKEK